MMPPAPGRTGWLGYIGVDDVDSIAERIAQAGGTVGYGPKDIPGVGRFAMVNDPQGALFAIFQPLSLEKMAPPAPPGVPGHVGWRELSTRDHEKAFAFYASLFGWTKDQAIDMGEMGTYQIFSIGGAPSGGMVRQPPEKETPCWGYYFNVPDIDSAIERARKAGGQILGGPHQVPGGSWIAHCRDPQGAAFALVGARKEG